MFSRRSLLATIGVAGVGGWAYYSNEEVRSQADAVIENTPAPTGPPETETKVKTVEGPTQQRYDAGAGEITEEYVSFIRRIEFFESGAAKIYPTADHGCFEGVALRHEDTNLPNEDIGVDTSEALADWELGDFDEVLTVDMAGAISGKSNYPNRKFVLQMVSYDGYCFAAYQEMDFTVPDSYLPD